MSDAEPFAELDAYLDDLAQRLTPAARRRVVGQIATQLRAARAKDLRANIQPDGTPMQPRKRYARRAASSVDGRIAKARKRQKRELMFQRAAGKGYLRRFVTDDGAEVGFVGAMARIMGVHQYGLRDRVSHQAGAPEAVYPERVVIGFGPGDEIMILERAMAMLGE